MKPEAHTLSVLRWVLGSSQLNDLKSKVEKDLEKEKKNKNKIVSDPNNSIPLGGPGEGLL